MGFYIRDDSEFHNRSDLTLSTDDFENLSIEIHRKSQSNIICFVIHGHPNNNFDNFFLYLTKLMDKNFKGKEILYFDG